MLERRESFSLIAENLSLKEPFRKLSIWFVFSRLNYDWTSQCHSVTKWLLAGFSWWQSKQQLLQRSAWSSIRTWQHFGIERTGQSERFGVAWGPLRAGFDALMSEECHQGSFVNIPDGGFRQPGKLSHWRCHICWQVSHRASPDKFPNYLVVFYRLWMSKTICGAFHVVCKDTFFLFNHKLLLSTTHFFFHRLYTQHPPAPENATQPLSIALALGLLCWFSYSLYALQLPKTTKESILILCHDNWRSSTERETQALKQTTLKQRCRVNWKKKPNNNWSHWVNNDDSGKQLKGMVHRG